MEIVILILKIIGIIIGSLFAVFLLLFGALLAVPVRYRMNTEVQRQKVSGKATFSWLFHIIDCRVQYSGKKIVYSLRVFGIRLGRRKGRKRKVLRTEEENLPNGIESPDQAKIHKGQDYTKEGLPDTAKDNGGGNFGDGGKEASAGSAKRAVSSGGNGKRRKPFWRMRRFLGNLKRRISDIAEGAASVKEKIQNIKKIVLDETNKNAFAQIWKELRFLVRRYSPRKASGEITFGMKDPAQTGQVLGALSVFPFWVRYRISIYPDFQSETFYAEGWLEVKGHIRLWHLLLSVIRLIKNKDIRFLVKKIRM